MFCQSEVLPTFLIYFNVTGSFEFMLSTAAK